MLTRRKFIAGAAAAVAATPAIAALAPPVEIEMQAGEKSNFTFLASVIIGDDNTFRLRLNDSHFHAGIECSCVDCWQAAGKTGWDHVEECVRHNASAI